MSFADLFAGDVEPVEPPEPQPAHERPVWLGPPDGELGVAVPLGLVLARGERGVVALSHALAHRSGISFHLVAHAGGLGRRQASSIFHEQHAVGQGADDLPDGFLRFGLELPDGMRVSNLGGRRPWAKPGDGPPGPLLVQQGGGGGRSGGDGVSWSVDFWLWPLPPPGTLRLYCEWPVAGVALSGAEVDTVQLLDAAARATRIWDGAQADGPWTSTVSQFALSRTSEAAAQAEGETVAVPASELRAAREALQAALRALHRLER